MHKADSEISFSHFLSQPLNFLFLVAKDNSLSDSELVIQVKQGFALVLFLLDGNEELSNPIESEFVPFNQYLKRVVHELVGHLKNFLGQGSGNNHTLNARGQVPVNVIHLVFESLIEHLVCFIQNEHLNRMSFEGSPLDHIEHSSRSATYYVHSMLQLGNVLVYIPPSDAAEYFHTHVIAKSHHHLLGLLG